MKKARDKRNMKKNNQQVKFIPIGFSLERDEITLKWFKSTWKVIQIGCFFVVVSWVDYIWYQDCSVIF